MLPRNALRLFAIPILAVVGSLTLPPPTGPYNVGQKAYVLEHITPDNPLWPNNISTSILVNLYYPTQAVATPVYYIWEGISKIYDEYFGVPVGSFRNITAYLAFDAPPLTKSGLSGLKLPTLMFGPPGGGPSSRLFTGLLSELVSHGYVVVTVDQAYEQPYLEYPDGTAYQGVLDVTWNGETYLEDIYAYRLTDNSAVLDALPSISNNTGIPLNLTHFVFFGHSIGGATATSQILTERNRAQCWGKTSLGAINIDGDIHGPSSQNDSSVDLHAPSLILKSSFRERGAEPAIALFESFQTSWIKEIRVLGKSNHTDFSDIIFLKQALGRSGGDGAIKAARMLEISRNLVKAFVDMVSGVDGGSEGVLSGNKTVLQEFPEILFEWNNTGNPCAPDLCQIEEQPTSA